MTGHHTLRAILGAAGNPARTFLRTEVGDFTEQDRLEAIAQQHEVHGRQRLFTQVGVTTPEHRVAGLHGDDGAVPHHERPAASRLTLGQALEHARQCLGLVGPVALNTRARMQPVILSPIHRNHLHVLLDRRNARQKSLAVETLGIQLIRWLVGGADHHHAFFEHHLEQPPEDNRVTDVIDEQFVEAQHAYGLAQFPGQGLQGVVGAGELEQTLMHPLHEVMEVLTPRWHLQALVELVHQPGLAPPHRTPQVHASDRCMAVVQGFVAGLQGVHRAALSGVGDETRLSNGVLVGSEGRVESHARQYELQRNIQPRNLALLVQAKGVAQLQWAAREIAGHDIADQHLAGTVLHLEHFDPRLVTTPGVFHPARNGGSADLVLALIEHIGILGKTLGDSRGVTGIGRRDIGRDGRCQLRDRHDTAPFLVICSAMLSQGCVSFCQE
ncbi:hypothetical protein ALQ17_05340 [Pseudomonas fluorescens]|nr:hypothetical protein ALQ17_05340 [Pseudomonas fluorescens]